MNPASNVKYILDTNILIGLDLWLPIQKFPKFWGKMSNSLQEGKWLLLDVVVAEINKYQNKNPLAGWCKQKRIDGLITDTTEFIDRSVEIHDTYPIIDEINKKSEADPVIIAFAESNPGIYRIFTRESHKGQNDKLHKIPDVCRAVGVKYNRQVGEFYEHIGFVEE